MAPERTAHVRDIVMAADRNDRREQESRRILKGIASEAGPGESSLAARVSKRAHDHLTAVDADQSDRIETWGTRIGRVLGMVIMIGLAVWLFRLLVSNG